MNINFNLVNASAKESPIRLVITHNRKQYRKSIGVTCPTADWSSKRQRSGHPKIDDRLRSIRIICESHLGEDATEGLIKYTMDYAIAYTPNEERVFAYNEMKSNRPSFWEYFYSWSEREMPSKRYRQLAYKKVRETMGTCEDWEEIDTGYYATLVERMQDAGYGKNYIGTIVAKLRTVMNEGEARKYHKSEEHHKFKALSEKVDSIYLTRDEVERLWQTEYTDPYDAMSRDLFLLGVYTASRWCDYSRLSKDNVQGNTIRFIQNKTNQPVILPLSPKVKEILDRNGGAAPAVIYRVFNRHIKTACQLAGIDGMIEVTKSKGRGHVHEMKPKWDLVSGHTARRTGISLLHQAGVPVHQLMLLSGHSSIQSFMLYLKTSREDNALLLADNPFFK